MNLKLLTLVLLLTACGSVAQVYRDSTAPVNERVKDLLERMTPEEKFWQLFMLSEDWSLKKDRYADGAFGFEGGVAAGNDQQAGQLIENTAMGSAAEMARIINRTQKFFLEKTRLGIPVIPFDEALHGLIQPGATVFPQAIGLAATFDTALMHRVAACIAIETKSRGIRQVLSPVINSAGDVRWGRVEETYGEDPFLTSEMAVAYISEFENRNIIATPKHFVSNYGAGGRDSYPIHFSERYLREVELPPFEAAIHRGGARSVMTAYNSLNGSPCSANDWLLNTLLKKEWGFGGFVISDAGATGGANVLHFTADSYQQSAENAINNGLDVIFQTAYEQNSLFIKAFTSGNIPDSVIDSAVARVLKAKFQLGLFDHPYVNPEQAARVNGAESHRQTALEAARECIVLLKNRNQVLPVSPSVRSIAVIGPDAAECRYGGYSGPGNRPVSLSEGLKKAVSTETRVAYLPGCSRKVIRFLTVPSIFLHTDKADETGLRGTYYANSTFTGKPAFIRTDHTIDFRWTLFSPDPDKLDYGFYSVCWNGKIKGPVTGKVKIGIDGNDGYRLYINNSLLIDNSLHTGCNLKTVDFDFVRDTEYEIRIEYAEPAGNSVFRLVWDYGIPDGYEKEMEQAVALASESDLIVLDAGIEEGEFRDRALLNLPGNQEELISRLAATGKPLVVVLTGGSAITMSNWLDKAAAVIDAWYPGEAGGTAVSDVLTGRYNPAGRLPITFPRSEGQLPLIYNHKPTGRGDDYDDLSGQPLFPFGYGLSYSSFSYDSLKISKEQPDHTFRVSFVLKNFGTMAGDEVVQLYIRDLIASLARPVTALKGFKRIHLSPGESKPVDFTITPGMLEMLDSNMETIVEPGDFRIMIGASSKDIRLSGILTSTAR